MESGQWAKLIFGSRSEISAPREVVLPRGEFQSVVRDAIARSKTPEVGSGYVPSNVAIGISTVAGATSFSGQKGHGDATYANLNEQAGNEVGAGEFDIDVADNTGLTGAVIASTADASKNTLPTGTRPYLMTLGGRQPACQH